MKKVLLKIGGMTCSACSSGLEKYLNKQDGIESAAVNLVMNNANIQYDEQKLDLKQIEKFVEKAGFESLGIDDFQKKEKKQNNQKYKLIALGVLAVITLYISMGHMIGLPAIPYLNMHENQINYALVLLILAITACIFGWDILKNGYKNLVHKSPNMDTLVGLGVLSSIIYSLYGTFMILKGNTEYVNNLYYESAVIIIFFIKIGKYVENRNKDKTKEAISQLMMITPKHATVLRDGEQVQVTIDEINEGDIVVCKPGEKIAVDGEIVDGITHIDESFITGESMPVKKEKGKKVIAGSINYEGTIEYKAEKIGKNSTVSEIVKLVVEATSTKAPIAKIADKISGIFVPTIIVIAVLSGLVWFAINRDVSWAINVFISVLVVACPCSLGLATPLSIVIASGESSKKGILIKNSEALENAHKVKTVVFDKTGTLTKGKLSLSKIYNYTENYSNNQELKADGFENVETNSNEKGKQLSDDDIIKIVASIESKSEHPIARGVVAEAKERKIELEKVKEFQNLAGLGVTALYNGEKYIIGNKKLMEQNGIEISSKNSVSEKADKKLKNRITSENTIIEKIGLEQVEKDEEELQKAGNSILFVAKENELIALLGVKDNVKENAKDVVSKLKLFGINVVMLTGDNEKTAKAIANSIGIDNVIAGVMPRDKAKTIENLKKNNELVMMCGDGINDSISLVKADIGVSVGNGTDVAMDSSNVVLMNNNLEKIVDLIEISGKTIRNIKQNLFWAFFYNLCMLPIAVGVLSPLGITINPMMASIAMTISSVTVTLNSLRLKRIIRKIK